MREAGYDVASMARTSTKVFVLEVMGRHAGWITAACGLAAENAGEPPHILLFPEVPFDPERFVARVDECVRQYGYCTIAVSEGLSDASGKLIADSGSKDAFGHSQLGGVGQVVAQLVKDKLGYKYHWALADYLQRSARHIASRTDVEQAHALGVAAVDLALRGKNAVMPTVRRLSDVPYRWEIGEAALQDVANVERKMPAGFISADGFHITAACRAYLQPLIEGEEPPPFRLGLPDYVRLKNVSVPRKLGAFTI
jgi:6-phosphofructokinase